VKHMQCGSYWFVLIQHAWKCTCMLWYNSHQRQQG